MQGDKKINECLAYVWEQVGPKGSSTKRTRLHKPFVMHCNLEADEEDRKVMDVVKGSPILHFMMRGSKFEKAVIAADGARFLVTSSMTNAVLVFISIFTVFHVGYTEGAKMFLAFLQSTVLGDEYTGKKTIGCSELLHEFATCKATVLRTYSKMKDRGVLNE